MQAQSHQLGIGLIWKAFTKVFEEHLAASLKHLFSRHSGLSVLPTQYITSCFFPWVPNYIFNIPNHLSEHLLLKDIQRQNSRYHSFYYKKKIDSRAWEDNGTLLYKQKNCLGIQFRSSSWRTPPQLLQSNLPLKAGLLTQVSCGFT